MLTLGTLACLLGATLIVAGLRYRLPDGTEPRPAPDAAPESPRPEPATRRTAVFLMPGATQNPPNYWQ